MPADKPRPNVLLRLAAEGVVPILGAAAGGAAKAVAGEQAGPVVGLAIEKGVEKAINIFGRGIVARWHAWFAQRPAGEVEAAVSELVELTPADARAQVQTILLKLAPQADPKELELAIDYLSAVPRAVDRALVPDPVRGGERSIPPTISLEDERSLLRLLPEDVPPYPETAELPGTPYRLVELLGAGGFGAVYRATSATLQHLPLAIKFCLDRNLAPALHQERSNLERLMRTSGPGAAHVIRLYGYDLDHTTPYLVYEYVAGGDLTRHLAARRASNNKPPTPDEVLGWIVQIAEGLRFAHAAGLVHRDLKPANVLVDGNVLKLADFGLGGVAAARAVARSRIGTSTLDYLSLADQASLFRGAGTPLYMSPEQRKGAAPDARHDLYALGVVWYQLLTGDVSRELHHGWAKELTVRFGVPSAHIALIERCVGWYDERPKDASELLPLLKEAARDLASGGRQPPVAVERIADVEPTGGLRPPLAPETDRSAAAVTQLPSVTDGARRTLASSLVTRLHAAHENLTRAKPWHPGYTAALSVLAGLAAVAVISLISEKPRAEQYFPVIITMLMVGTMYFVVARLWSILRFSAAKKTVADKAHELASAFPDLVADAGGEVALRNAETIAWLREQLAASSAPVPATPNPLRAVAETVGPRRTLLQSLMNRLVAANWDAAKLWSPSWLVPNLVLSLAVCCFIGWFAGEVFYLLAYPANNSAPNVFRRDLPPFPLAVVGGFAVAIAAWIGYALLVRWWMHQMTRAAQRRAAALVEEITAGFPATVAGWGGIAALRDPDAAERLREELAADDPLPPSGLEATGPRRELLGSVLQRLALAHHRAGQATWWQAHIAMGFVIALVIGWLAGEATHLIRYPDDRFPSAFVSRLSIFDRTAHGVGWTLGFAVWGGFVFAAGQWAARRRAESQAQVESLVGELTGAFPESVAAWGGPSAFRDPDTVDRLHERLESPVESAVPFPSNPRPLAGSTVTPSRLGQLLARLERTHAELNELKGWPLWETIVWGFFPALIVGWLAGEAVYAIQYDGPFPKALTPAAVGNDWVSNIAGGVVGFGVWFVYVWVIRSGVHASADDVRKRGVQLVNELAASYPAEVESWGGRFALADPTTVRRVRDELALPPSLPTPTSGMTLAEIAADATRKSLFLSRVRELRANWTSTSDAQDGSWLGLIGLWIITVGPSGIAVANGFGNPNIGGTSWGFAAAAGVTVAAFVAWLEWSAMAMVRRKAKQTWSGELERFTGDYPKVVAAWGGRESLTNVDTLDTLMKNFDPHAAIRPGFWRRMFGG